MTLCAWGKGPLGSVCNVCVHMGICTLMLDPGPVMFLGPGTGTSHV